MMGVIDQNWKTLLRLCIFAWVAGWSAAIVVAVLVQWIFR